MNVQDSRFADWLVGSLRTGLIAIGTDGAVTALSAEGARILGCPRSAGTRSLGRPCRELLAEQPEVASLLEDALDGRERPSRAELRLRGTETRDPCTIGYTLLPVRDEVDALRGTAMVFRDLTIFERQDERERLDERLRALGQMAAGLAHEIRNPLASMELMVGLLKRRLGERPEALELTEEIGTELRGLAAIVQAGLDFVRPAALQREDVDCGALLGECVALALARVPFAGRVDCQVAPGAAVLEVDRERLRSALVNLAVNALQSMVEQGGEDGELSVRVEPEEHGGVRLSVADTGPGVPTELRERIFYPFFTTRESGSGVGLADAQKVVASHGGTIEVMDRPGGGAIFRIYLPDPPRGAP